MRKYKGNYAEMFKRLDAKYNRQKSVRLRLRVRSQRSTLLQDVPECAVLARLDFFSRVRGPLVRSIMLINIRHLDS